MVPGRSLIFGGQEPDVPYVWKRTIYVQEVVYDLLPESIT